MLENIRLGKLVHGGQCLAQNENGKTVFVWGGLPDELVDVRVIKKKSSHIEAIVTEVHESSPDRIEPTEPLSYLSTSPWQIMSFDAENTAKQAILAEAFERESLTGIEWQEFKATDQEFGYRNKQEYGFWGNNDGLSLAHFVRGTHGKQMVQGSVLAMDCINEGARAVRDELNRLKIWGGDLKTIILRANQQKKVVGALFIKKSLNMDDFRLPKELKGLDIYYSEPKSPASVTTEKLYSLGDITLTDTVMSKNIIYDVMSFFQVNLPIFQESLLEVKSIVDQILLAYANKVGVVDMYSGVGTIGLAVGATILVESDSGNIKMMKENARDSNIVTIVHATSETALEHIDSGDILIVDPPRAGLHKDLTTRIAEAKPLKIIYLSCNPSTQARDIKLLEENYNVMYARGYNFFPRTPHIESLVVLELK